ncbi:LysR substrate-binding domain-containing protein [Arsenicicoccus piscis]|uniref:LysR family transcriptional regulator n=1 Tax=Arsenicicoccus piscis TaxID=673954 RepID=A0ABQ6HMT1_9MICO|nr:LysR substrate-binding domain-containing protein [Arsenicicoccus piscis]MCH8629290.1 LysR substrate-binding domain-containing protein [Arsenicicoccus piscis]GMA19749.1 LysR family transcriptional regulator [Arsenicicoccus piscis]GMA22045.1 LysR family transcriptional regulator [Arsenicicoccus piscis]
MELRHLRYFVAVAEQLHFGRAAQSLHMAQPPLSHAIRQLEEEMSVELLTRTTRTVALTPAGAAFYTDCVRTLAEIDESVERARRVAEGRTGLLRLGLVGSVTSSHLPELARLLKDEMPAVALEVHVEMLTPAQTEALESGRLDLGLLRPPAPSADLTTRLVAHEPLVLALPRHHRLVGDPDVRLDDLRHEAFVTYAASSGSVVSHTIDRACRAAGFVPQREHEVRDTSTLLALVAAGLGVALVPASARAASPEGVTFAELPDAPTVDLALAWRTDDASPLVSRLVGVLERHHYFVDAAAGAAAGAAVDSEEQTR